MDLIDNIYPDIFMLQEHWLTPDNLNKFDIFTNYFTFGCSSMTKHVESGLLKGRPFGGIMIMIKHDLRKFTETIYCTDRCAIVRVADVLFITVYLPCIGTTDRLLICQDIFNHIWAFCEQFPDCSYLIGGDYNVNLDSNDKTANYINKFISERALLRCDDIFHKSNIATYVNTALNHQSTIDYFVTSSSCNITEFSVLDPDVNFSDHLPIMAVCRCTVLHFQQRFFIVLYADDILILAPSLCELHRKY